MKRLPIGLALFWVSLAAHPAELPKPPEEYFGEFSGCALILTRDRHRESWFEFGTMQCATPMSPCSTFKIPNALIGLQEGVVSGPEQSKPWDGKERSREITNRDHTLATAIEHSVVWYFQSLARDVGVEAMQAWLDRLRYGNRDISAGIDRFWLGSSLEIDAYAQLELLKKLKHGTLPFRPVHQQQVAEMLLQDSDLPGTLRAKTGSCRGATDEEPDHGWFIGWVEWDKGTGRNPVTSWFVINITGEEAWGWKARPIALQLLHDLQH